MGTDLGLHTDSSDGSVGDQTFKTIDLAFNAIYLAELLIRVWIQKLGIFNDVLGCADTLIILACCIDSFVLQPLNQTSGVGVVELARILRIMRAMRVLKFTKVFPSCPCSRLYV